MGIAAAIAGAAVIGGVTTVISGNKAANAQKQAADASVAEQQRQYDQTRADQAPWRTAGAGALSKLAGLYGVDTGNGATKVPNDQLYDEFRATPGYQFQMSEGLKAVDRGAAARGLLGSGAAVKGEQRFGAGLADQTYGQYVGALQSLAGVGQTATQATSQAGQSAANNISNAYMAAGNARASSYANTGSAINGTLNSLASVYAYGKGGGFGNSGGANAYGIVGSGNIY
jgi:hypothetical protein